MNVDFGRPVLKNRTRRSASIPRMLVRNGQVHLLPFYYVLRLSDLAREGIDNSGSYRFADHIYVGRPSGTTPLGRWLDALLLEMPAARALRRRYQKASSVVRQSLAALPADGSSLRVLATPCGIPRDILELARRLKQERPALLARLEYCGMDLDAKVVQLAGTLLRDAGLDGFRLHCGDALSADEYPSGSFHVAISTGLGEFLTNDELIAFYGHIHRRLEPGGVFYTSASARGRGSDALLRLAEIIPHYRDPIELEPMLRQYPWSHVTLTRDPTGLQAFVTAVK